MWKLFGPKKQKKPLTPEEIIEQAIFEMEDSLQKSNQSLRELTKTQQDIAQKQSSYEYQAEGLKKDAAKLLKQGDEQGAKHILNQKAEVDEQVKHYAQLNKTISANLIKMQKQVVRMRMQLEETKAKRVLLTAELAQAKTQKEMALKLQELGDSTEAFEQSVLQYQIEADLTEDDLEKEFALLEANQNTDLKELMGQIEQEEKQAEQARLAQKQKKIDLFLGPSNTTQETLQKKQQELEEKKKQLLGDFFESQDQPSAQQNKKILEDFLNENQQDLTDSQELKEKIDSFFADKTYLLNQNQKDIPQIPSKDKQKKLKDFFGEPSENQKKMDDFFKK